MKPALAGATVAAAGIALALPLPDGPGRLWSALLAGLAAAAILSVWGLGLRARARRSAWDRWTGAGLATSLGGGVLGAALLEGSGAFGLPRALWALLLGVFLVPLVLTNLGFFLSFEPPAPEDLRRIRQLRGPRGPEAAGSR